MKIDKDRFYISGIADNLVDICKKYGFGIEHTKFTYTRFLDVELEEAKSEIIEMNKATQNLIFHAPFTELTMAPIDDKVGEVSLYRYNQFYSEAKKFNPKKLVYHTGYLKKVYYMEWFVPESIKFLINFLNDKSVGPQILIENVFSESPDYIYEILKKVNEESKVPLYMCLDIGHINAYAHDTTVFSWIDKCKKYITHIHIHNNNGENDYHKDVYDGTLDIKMIIDYAISVIPDVTFTVEVREPKDFPEFIKKNYL